jgi:cold shock CspA family protein
VLLEIRRGNFPLTGESEAYIRERAEHLERFHPRILSCRVTVEGPINHHAKGGPYAVRLDIDIPGKVLVVNHRRAGELHVAIRRAFEAAARQAEEYAEQRGTHEPAAEPQLQNGTVSRLFSSDGFGFIDADGTDVYFHQNAVAPPGFGALAVGHKVEFMAEPGDKGPQAVMVRRLGA